MCGFCGIYHLDSSKITIPALKKMTELVRHRGPDDEGYLLINTGRGELLHCCGQDTVFEIKSKTIRLPEDFDADLGFGFRRLAIIDLSAKGHQPMCDKEHGIWIVYNGEVYNYIELREELRSYGHRFISNTDTEVIIKAYVQWGIGCVSKFNGMWAFAIWDEKKQLLFCSRDRFGIKPFYYFYEKDKRFIFASEIKSILECVDARTDYHSLNEFLAFGQLDHSEKTFFENIRQLRGSHSLVIRDKELSIERYYDIIAKDSPLSNSEPLRTFREVFFDSVRLRLRSDVELGFALSGGLDSSSIVTAAREINGNENSNTFSTIYPHDAVDETFFIEKVVQRTGFKCHFITPTATMFMNDLEKFVWHQEEPNNGTSYFAEFVLRRLIKSAGVTVSLEGQGADEVISGYRSLISPYLQDLLRSLRVLEFFTEYRRFHALTNMSKLEVIGNVLAVVSPPLYGVLKRRYMLHSLNYLDVGFVNRYSAETIEFPIKKEFSSFLNQRLYNYLFYTSIPSQLVRADKSAMAFSVECRFPFLDYRLAEFCFTLPYDYKIRKGRTKYVLREAMKDYLPIEVYKRYDKKGFPTPQEKWFKGEMRDFISDIVYSTDFKKMPFLNWKNFVKDYNLFQQGKVEFDTDLWCVLHIYLWQKQFGIN